MEVFCINKNELLINEEIRDKEVRLIDTDGTTVGIVPIKEARDLAMERKLDLVKIAPQSNPPVCKIMDYGKHVFDLAKKGRESKKKQKTMSLKEVRLTPSIGEHDYGFKLKNALKFLKSGDKLKVSVRFRGREMHYTKAGEDLLNRFAEDVKEFGAADGRPKLEGRNMTLIINSENSDSK